LRCLIELQIFEHPFIAKQGLRRGSRRHDDHGIHREAAFGFDPAQSLQLDSVLHYFLLCSHIRRVLVDPAWLNTADNNLRQSVRYTMAKTSDQIQVKPSAAPRQPQISAPGSAAITVLLTSTLLAAVYTAPHSAIR
jgi:hypothetical protein